MKIDIFLPLILDFTPKGKLTSWYNKSENNIQGTLVIRYQCNNEFSFDYYLENDTYLSNQLTDEDTNPFNGLGEAKEQQQEIINFLIINDLINKSLLKEIDKNKGYL